MALAAGDHGVGPWRELRDAEALKRGHGDHAVPRGRAGEQIAMRSAAHQHHCLDGKGKGRDMGLRHIGDQPRALSNGAGRQGRAAEPHFAGSRVQQAEQRLEQRGLAAAIGSEQRQHLALFQPDIEPAADDTVGIADGQFLALEDHDQFFCTLASSQMKNGVPITAVKMPSGISTCAIVRASVSISKR